MVCIYLCRVYKEEFYTKRSVCLDAFQLQQFTDIFCSIYTTNVYKVLFYIKLCIAVDAFSLCKFTDVFV